MARAESLIYCTKCGHVMLDQVPACPACGSLRYRGDTFAVAKPNNWVKWIALAVTVLLGIVYGIYFRDTGRIQTGKWVIMAFPVVGQEDDQLDETRRAPGLNVKNCASTSCNDIKTYDSEQACQEDLSWPLGVAKEAARSSVSTPGLDEHDIYVSRMYERRAETAQCEQSDGSDRFYRGM